MSEIDWCEACGEQPAVWLDNHPVRPWRVICDDCNQADKRRHRIGCKLRDFLRRGVDA